MKKILIVMLASLALTQTVRSQTDSCTSKNWYIDLAVGGGVTVTEQIVHLECPDFIAYRISMAAGKWINPWLGARLQITTGAFHLSHSTSNEFTEDYGIAAYANIVSPDGYYMAQAPFINPHIDLQLSFLSLLGHPQCKWDAVLSVGGGYLHVFKKDGIPASDWATFNAGLMAKYRLNDKWEFYAEAQSALFSDKFDARITDRKCASNLTVNLGVSYFIDGRCFPNAVEETAELLQIQETVTDSTRIHHDTIIVPQYIEKIVEVKKEAASGLPIAAFNYNIGEIQPEGNSTEQTIKQIVKIMEENPDKKIHLCSYADKETGSEKRNMELAKLRIGYIRDMMVDKHSVSKDRIIEKPYGSSVQLFNSNQSQNRVTWVFLLNE